MPSLLDYITETFIKIDDYLNSILKEYGNPLRARGFKPKLSDSELITIKIIGELCSIDSTVGIWRYTKKHWSDLFPNLPSRSQFAKQCQNLWAVKQKILEKLNSSGYLFHIIDGFPIAVCHNKRIINCKRFKGEAARGYCASKEQCYYGFKGHLDVNQDDEIINFNVTPASVDEREMIIELLEGKTGLTLGDKGYLGTKIAEQYADIGIAIETPVRKNMRDKLPKNLRNFWDDKRRVIESTIGQLAEIFNIERTLARTVLSFTNRLTRKILSHKLATLFNKAQGRPILKVADLAF